MLLGGLIYKSATVGEIIKTGLKDRPFLHEQGQVVLRGYVQSLDISDTQWTLHMRDLELLNKMSCTFSHEQPAETFHGPLDRTSFFRCWNERCPTSEPAVQIDCYGSLIHVGLSLDDPWRANRWPELDTEFLPSCMRPGDIDD